MRTASKKFIGLGLAVLLPLALSSHAFAEHGAESGHERPQRYSLPGKIKPKELKEVTRPDGARSIITGQEKDKNGRIKGDDHSHSVVKGGKVVYSRTQGGTVVHDAGENKKPPKTDGGKNGGKASPSGGKGAKPAGSNKPQPSSAGPKQQSPKPSASNKAAPMKVHDEHPPGTRPQPKPDWRRQPAPKPAPKVLPPRPNTTPITRRPVHDEHPSGLNMRTSRTPPPPKAVPESRYTVAPRPAPTHTQPPAPRLKLPQLGQQGASLLRAGQACAMYSDPRWSPTAGSPRH